MTTEASGSLDVVLFSGLTDTIPQPRRVAWDDLADDLSEHDERTEKDGPGWSATVYREHGTRGKRGVEAVTALVLDVDHDEPVWTLLDGLEYVAHTTWKHFASDEHEGCGGRDDCPHWRIVLPLRRPVPSAEWDAFRSRARFWHCPNADESAKDAPRFFWLPTSRPGKARDTRRGRGRWLDPDELPELPDIGASARITPESPAVGLGERPGDRFGREADWCRDILPNWTPVGIHGDNLMLRRPGSTNPYGATISQRGRGVLYVFTDAAPPLAPNTCYSKFGAYATLKHGGDFGRAASALAERHRQNGSLHADGRLVDAGRDPLVVGVDDPLQVELAAPGVDLSMSFDEPVVDLAHDPAGAVLIEERSDQSGASDGTAAPSSIEPDGSDRNAPVKISGANEPEGIHYRVDRPTSGKELSVLVTPLERGQRVTIRCGSEPLDVTTLDLAKTNQRRTYCAKAPVATDEERKTLERLLLHVALNLDEDQRSWITERTEEMARRMAEVEAARERRLADERRALEALAWEMGREILEDPALLYHVGEVCKAIGLAGEDITSRLTYLLLTSRVGDQPINAAIKGSSSAGKSYTLETVTRLFPESAFWKLTAMSAKALVYIEESFSHRVIMIYEQHGGEEADYFIRTLQSEGHLRYVVTQKDPLSGNMVAVTIDKPGPTSFITTTTRASLHNENETRLWSVTVDESEGQTERVLGSVARRYSGVDGEPDLEPWQSAQEWLGAAGATSAVIAYAAWLSNQMPKKPLRIRRDFGRLLELIKTSAILFQAQRERDGAGRVIADVRDYANAHVLLPEVFQATQRGLTKRGHEILEKAQEIYDTKLAAASGERGEVHVGFEDLIAEFGVTKSTISRHLKVAAELGLVENLEARETAPARFRPHLELVASTSDLPSPAALAEAFPKLGGLWTDPLTGEEKWFGPPPSATPATEPKIDPAPDHGSVAESARNRPAIDMGHDATGVAGAETPTGARAAAGSDVPVSGLLRAATATEPPGGEVPPNGAVAGIAGESHRDQFVDTGEPVTATQPRRTRRIRPPDPLVTGKTPHHLLLPGQQSQEPIRRLFNLVFRDAWTVFDLTVGAGGCWSEPLPPGITLTTNDLNLAIAADFHLDYRATGLPEGFRDVIVYDPPHTSDNGESGHFRRRYGGTSKGNAALIDDVVAGALEAWRIAGVGMIAKVIDASHGGEWVSLSQAIRDAIPAPVYCELITVRPNAIPDPKRRRHRVPENNGAIYLVYRKDSHHHLDFDTLYERQEARRIDPTRR